MKYICLHNVVLKSTENGNNLAKWKQIIIFKNSIWVNVLVTFRQWRNRMSLWKILSVSYVYFKNIYFYFELNNPLNPLPSVALTGYAGKIKIVLQVKTTLPTIQCERQPPHLRRVEPVDVGTFVGCCCGLEWEKCLTGGVRRPEHRIWKEKLSFEGRLRRETGRRFSEPQMVSRGLSNRAHGEMSRTVSAFGNGKRD